MGGLSTPAKVGLLTLAALILLGIVVIWKTDIFMIKQGYEMTGSFESIEGLTIGSEVRYRGFTAGKVLKIDPGPQDIRVYAVINKKIKFPADSYLRIAYDGIVGQKYLEVRPGSSESIYKPPQLLYGIKVSGIVDFVDIGAQNLEETKAILENIRAIIERPDLQRAFIDTVFTADKVANDLEKLTAELRQTNQGIREIVTDPEFQASLKGTIKETDKTLSSANKFFADIRQIKLRASGGVDIGTRSNTVKSNVDIVSNQRNYLRFGIGEGPTRQLSLLDILVNSQVSERFGFRLGVINSQLGGGVVFYPSGIATYRFDVYDLNNPRPNWPKLRLGLGYEVREYMDLTLQGDDLLNEGSRNISIGILVKPTGENVF